MTTTTPTKHSEFILALDKTFITNVLKVPAQKVTYFDLKDVVDQAQSHLVLRQRRHLENDPDYLQVLPIITFFRMKDGAVKEVFTYQRSAFVGESRLAGNASIHIGGHVEALDVIWNLDNSIDFEATINGVLRREGSEEVAYSFDEHGKPEFAGLIYDPSNDVGRVHVAFHFIVVLQEGVELTIQEKELIQIGFVDIDELSPTGVQAELYDKLENWPKIALLGLEPDQQLG